MASRGTYDTRAIRRLRDGYTLQQIAELTRLPVYLVQRELRPNQPGVRLHNGRIMVSRAKALDYIRRKADHLEEVIFQLATEDA